jgi:hypothetical protein
MERVDHDPILPDGIADQTSRLRTPLARDNTMNDLAMYVPPPSNQIEKPYGCDRGRCSPQIHPPALQFFRLGTRGARRGRLKIGNRRFFSNPKYYHSNPQSAIRNPQSAPAYN